jgi:hypothetical protein
LLIQLFWLLGEKFQRYGVVAHRLVLLHQSGATRTMGSRLPRRRRAPALGRNQRRGWLGPTPAMTSPTTLSECTLC